VAAIIFVDSVSSRSKTNTEEEEKSVCSRNCGIKINK